jgi:hypothetical protein
MIDFIIMTTAIIRPPLHKKSIGSFYETYYRNYKEYIDQNFKIHHIINIDSPPKLKPHFTVEQTVQNFNNIIPDTVDKHYIITEEPGFGLAFQNIMNKIKEIGLLDQKHYYFWFEDDWCHQYTFNLFMYIKEAMKFKCCAMTNTHNAQCGSFRGGPIMNGEFFLRYFNLVNLGLFSSNKDPERQVVRYIGKYSNFNARKLPDRDRLIHLIQLNRKGVPHVDNLGYELYKTKFNNLIEYKKHSVVMEYPDRAYYMDFTDRPLEDTKNMNNYKVSHYNEVVSKLDTDSIVFIVMKPYNFIDCGRDFAQQYGLIKWGDTKEITYA